jgi:hypothetical protein
MCLADRWIIPWCQYQIADKCFILQHRAAQELAEVYYTGGTVDMLCCQLGQTKSKIERAEVRV